VNNVLSNAINQILEKIDEEITKIKKSLDRIRITPKKIDLSLAKDDFTWCAIDSSWQTPPVEFIAKTIAIVYTGAYSNVEELNTIEINPFVHEGSNFDVEVYWFSAVKERQLALELIRQTRLDLLILDGTITPSPALASTPWDKVEKILKVTEKLIETAKENKTTIIGVVKRARAQYLSTIANADIPDKLLATALLDYNEYIDLGPLDEVLYSYITTKRHRTGEFLSRLAKSSSFLHKIREIYYRPLSRHAIRVEIIEHGPTTEEVLAFLAKNATPNTGFPVMLDFVDLFVTKNKVSTQTLKEILQNSILTRYDDPTDVKIAYILCGLQNPQKEYLYRLKGY
jgi:hypothetical protein